MICWALAGASLVTIIVSQAPPAEARYATGGSGAYKGAIDWFEWGATNHELIPETGLTKTNTRTVAGQALATTCTLSNIVNESVTAFNKLSTYRSGVWGGDGMDDLYNIGGTGNSNQLIAGLVAGGKSTFHVSCSVTLDGTPVPLAGLVMADAEQSLSYEYVEATTPAGSDWRLIDRIRTAGCTQGGTATRTGQTLRLSGSAALCSVGPDGIAFMEGATSADVVIQGGGASAIALGVMLFTDFGDAPASYGDAGALFSPGFAGAAVPEGVNSIFGLSLNTPTQPTMRLGATVDSEGSQQNSAGAAGDGSDEDAIQPPGSITVTPGTTYTLPDVACSGGGTVAGWIDWNKNGAFDPGERSTTPVCTGSSVDLSWSVPNFVADGGTFLRLRIGGDAAAVASPTGVSTSGEVEDYAVTVLPRADFGDAPNSAGTTRTADGARHLVPGYDSATSTAPVMLGSHIDIEDDGQPQASADGDDTNGSDDEDGVTFNPQLGYPDPTILSGTNAITLAAPVNHLTLNASATGFASVWVDWNGDGDFVDAGEQVADATAVSAGDNDLTFSSETNPNDIRTLVRVRYSTDAASIHTPTGPAPDGEVEDYRVLVERQIVPAACAPVTQPFYAMTFRSIKEITAGSGLQSGARYPEVTLIGGRPVDMLIQFVGGHAIRGFTQAGDDAGWQLNGSGAAAQITYTFVESGTTTPVAVNGVWTFNDMDAGELAQIQKDALAGYAVTPGSQVKVSQQTPYTYFAGTVGGNGAPESRFQIWFQGKSTFTSIWRGFANSGFFLDGDNDIPVPQSCDDYGDAPNSYGTLLAANGPHHHVIPGLRLGAEDEFDGDGQPTPGADGDDTNRTDDEDGVSTPITMTVGRTGSVTVNATNQTNTPATLAGWIDLNGNGTFDPAERVVTTVPANTAATNYQLDFGKQVSAAPTYARFRLFDGAVSSPSPTGPASAGEVEDYPVAVKATKLVIDKSSSFTADTRPGDTVTYTIKATNTGTADYTAADPARIVDNLTDVLDDATYDGNAQADTGSAPSYSAPNLVWSGALNAGATVTLTYTMTVKGGGDGQLRNVAFQGSTTPPASDPPFCPQPSLVCDSQVDELPKLTIRKTASQNTLPALGGTLTYTVTVTNTGMGSFTSAKPAIFDDDLSQVLDDATFNSASASLGSATLNGQTLHWSSVLPLGPGQSATITYSVTYHATGDHALVNTACVPASDAKAPTDNCRTTTTPGSGLRQTKTVDPASGTSVVDGQVLTYTLTFENVGGADATVLTSDDVSGVLDDATLVSGPTSDGLGVRVEPDGPPSFIIDGTVPVGQTRTVTYQVKVKSWAQQGDHILENSLDCEQGDSPCAPATTTNPVRHLEITKTSDVTADAKPGDQVTYTVTATDVGPGDYTAANPAVVLDDLSGVLDDADFGGSAQSSTGPDPTYAAPRLRWSGALEHGSSMTMTYTVTLTGGGDGKVANVAWQGGPDGTPDKPDCQATTITCAPYEFDLPKLSIRKSSNRASLPHNGDSVTYTVTETNSGPGDYTPGHLATFVDDLTDVLDDTSGPSNMNASVGTALFAGSHIIWSGVLAHGDSATITYTLIYDDTKGDHVVDNLACIPADEALAPGDRCRTVHTPGSGLRQTKSVDPASGTSVVDGQVLTYTLTFENVGPADAAVDTHDDLSGVLDDASLVPDSIETTSPLTAQLDDSESPTRLDIGGTVPQGETLTVTYQVKVKAFGNQGDHTLANALACEQGDPASCMPATTTNPVRHLVITKTSDATADVKPGDDVHYTVTATNDGSGDFTQSNPASVVDDLAGVLDDATFDGHAVSSRGSDPTYDEPRISWSGSLGHGDSVSIGYTVTLKGGGDGDIDNVAWLPSGTPGPTPACDSDDVPVACSSADLPKLTLLKTASRTELPAVGQKVTFTVTVTNTGPGDYTDAHPALVTDDLSDVLDDATLDNGSPSASSGAASVTDTTLTWTGALAHGDSATITYTFTYTGAGDHRLDNQACVPAVEAQDAATACATVHVPGSGLVHSKTVDPASGTPVKVGQVLTYTLTFQNVGETAATVDTHDDLSQVLDDASVTAGPTAGQGLNAELDGDQLDITGSVPAGESRTVTYEVTVEDFADQGDHVLTNALACEPDDPAGCEPATTTNAVQHLTVTKVRTGAGTPDTGDTVGYAITVDNDGAADYTAGDPASVVDDLTGVLDDATFSGGAIASTGTISYAEPELTWTGALAQGESAQIGYQVVVTNLGNHRLRNVASQVGCTDPACSPDAVVVDLPHVVPSKSVDAEQPLNPGDVVTYTLSWTNDGTAAGTVDSTDDLSGILDDAELTGGPTSSDGDIDAEITGSTLRVTGPIAADGTVTVTYEVTIKAFGERGDDRLLNALVPDVPQVDCDAESECTPVDPPGTVTLVGDLEDSKTVDPESGTTVNPGDVVTYTLHFHNAGTGPVQVNREDDLTGVLDDADLVSGPEASDASLAASDVTDGRFAVTGTLAADQTVTVSYSVRIGKAASRGDSALANFLLDPGQSAPAGCGDAAPDCTTNPVSDIVATKSVVGDDPAQAGAKLTYTLTFHNVGKGIGNVDYVDDMTNVLDDADLIGAPQPSDDTWNAELAKKKLRVAGTLAGGQTTTVTYSVRVRAYADQGDHRLVNYLIRRGDPAPATCDPATDQCTESVVAAPGKPGGLPNTGADVSPWELAAGLLSLLLGLALVLAANGGTKRRRRESIE